MQQAKNFSALPDYIVKSTFGISLISALLITPFSINNFIQGRYLLAIFTLVVAIFCAINAWFCYQGKYKNEMNLYGIVPLVMITTSFAINKLGVMGSYWAFMGMLSFYFILPEKQARIINVIFFTIIIPVAWNALESDIAIQFTAVLVGTSIYAFISIRAMSKLHNLLREHAITDTLTGLNNRVLLQSSLEKAIHQNDRANIAMTLIMLDLDHFKKINDELGHDVGDSVLKLMGDFLKQYFRATDMIFRVGGEEFLALIYSTDQSGGLIVAEKLRQEIEKLPLIPNRTVTASIGISSLEPGMSWKEWMKNCDENLYLAKSRGRNQVVA